MSKYRVFPLLFCLVLAGTVLASDDSPPVERLPQAGEFSNSAQFIAHLTRLYTAKGDAFAADVSLRLLQKKQTPEVKAFCYETILYCKTIGSQKLNGLTLREAIGTFAKLTQIPVAFDDNRDALFSNTLAFPADACPALSYLILFEHAAPGWSYFIDADGVTFARPK